MVCLLHKIRKLKSNWKIKGFEDKCLKARSNNIFICPKKTSKKNMFTYFFNKELSGHACCKSKGIWKKSKKKRRKRRSRGRRRRSRSRRSKKKS